MAPEHLSNIESLISKGKVCTCLKCTKKHFNNDTLSCSQEEFVKKANLLLMLQAELDITCTHEVLKKTSQAMDVLSDVPNSQEYRTSLTIFRKFVMFCEALETENFDIL